MHRTSYLNRVGIIQLLHYQTFTILIFCKYSKVRTLFLFRSLIRAGIHKMLIRIANRKDTQKQFDLGLRCLTMTFWQTTSAGNFRKSTVTHPKCTILRESCSNSMNQNIFRMSSYNYKQSWDISHHVLYCPKVWGIAA